MNQKSEIIQLKRVCTLCMLIFSIYIGNSQHIQRDTIYAKKLLQKADSLTEKGKYEASTNIALQAAVIFKAEKNWKQWFQAYNAIFFNGYYPKKYDTTIRLVEKGLPTLPTSETFLLGRLQYILGFCYERKGAIFDALPYYEKSLQNFKIVKNADFTNQLYGNISQLYTQLGEYQKAITYLKNAIADGKSTNNTLVIWRNTKALGDAYLHNGELQKARKTYKQAQLLIDEKDGTFERYEAEILYKLAAYEKALIVTQKALLIAENCIKDTSRKQRDCIENFNTMSMLLGDIYAELGNTQKALIQYQKSLLPIQKIGNLRETGQVYIAIGNMYEAQKQYDKALENHQKALQTFIPDFKENDPNKNPSQDLWTLEIWVLEVFKSKGDCYFEKYLNSKNDTWLQKAAENYNFAVTLGERIRLSYTETTSKLSLGSHTIAFYEDLIKVKLALYERSKNEKYKIEAFQISQKANAFVLRELFNEKQALTAAGIPTDTIILFQKYRKEIALLDEELADTITHDSIQNVLVTTKELLQKLKDNVSEKYPKFTKIRNDLEGIKIQQVQATIDSKTVFIKYFLGDQTLYIFSISKTDFHIDQISLPENFQQTITAYRQSLSDITFINQNIDLAEKQYLKTAHELYKLILEKPLNHYKNNADIQQLTIVPDDVLHTIPFQTLLINKSDSWTNLDHTIIKKYAVSYHYFCKMLLNSTVQSERTNNFTAFGLELDQATLHHLKTLTKDSLQNSIITKKLRNDVLSKLTFSDDEALQLATLMNGKSWVNEHATKQNFIENATNSASIHLATHSLVNTRNPNVSALIFTKTTDTSSNLLRLSEIYNHNFNSNMITLSACNTGFGKHQKGEGLQSLARAFNFSNIPSVTATLWSIPDASSAKIMELYYSYLKQGCTKSVALQKAQLEYVTNDEISSPASRLPFYWSAWTHIGTNDAITFEQQNNYIYYIVIALILLVMLIGLQTRKKLNN